MIGPGQELTIPVSVGTHVVQARVDWSGSPRVSVDVTEGTQTRLVVSPAGNAAAALFQLGRTRYLNLELA